MDAFRRRTPAERTALEYETRRYESDVENYNRSVAARYFEDGEVF